MTGRSGDAEFGAAWSASLRRGTDDELRSWVEAALAWVDETDAIALRHFRQDIAIERKPDRTFVTAADKAVEARIRERIGGAFPDHGVVGEELGDTSQGSSVRWYLDPIDGTHNFMRGIPVFATLLAAERDGELQAAVVSAPAMQSRWYGWRGGGAWAVERGGAPRRVHVSRIATVDEAQIVYAGTADMEASGLAPGFGELRRRAWRERGFGDFWGHLLVAEGAAEAMAELDLSPWDYAAPKLMVEEAGGRVTDFDGSRALDGRTFLATNGIIHDSVRGILTASPEEAR